MPNGTNTNLTIRVDAETLTEIDRLAVSIAPGAKLSRAQVVAMLISNALGLPKSDDVPSERVMTRMLDGIAKAEARKGRTVEKREKRAPRKASR